MFDVDEPRADLVTLQHFDAVHCTDLTHELRAVLTVTHHITSLTTPLYVYRTVKTRSDAANMVQCS